MTESKIVPEQSTHWYRPDGTPAYGAKMQQARKEGLYPSVTTVMNVIKQPGIEAWKINNMLNVAYELMLWRSVGEDSLNEKTIADFRRKVKNEWEKRTTKARDLGTKYHAVIEGVLTGKEIEDPEVNTETIDALRLWLKNNRVEIGGVETPFASPMLYGGRVDLWGKWRGGRDFVADWKSKVTTGKSDKSLFYPEHPMQLAACAYGLGLRGADLVSVIVSTDEPAVIKEKIWANDSGGTYRNGYWFERFLNRFQVWKDEHNYNIEVNEDELEG